MPGQGNSHTQVAAIADGFVNSSAALNAIDGLVQHTYFGDGFAGIDTENSFALTTAFDKFITRTGRSDLDFHVTEWSPREGFVAQMV
jgi:hypothetical protein